MLRERDVFAGSCTPIAWNEVRMDVWCHLNAFIVPVGFVLIWAMQVCTYIVLGDFEVSLYRYLKLRKCAIHVMGQEFEIVSFGLEILKLLLDVG